ncbi:MAG: tRNA(5-methylaminomethyl-2-thiouridylate) methyltransferase [Phascolarctobacterium sp.]
MKLLFEINQVMDKYDAVALFSGGLDSILAMRVIMDQGLKVLGLHFVSPFFGEAESNDKWQELYGVEVRAVDVSEEIIALIKMGPKNGFGSDLNPCTDCHTLMATKAREIMEAIHAKFIISGEVLWQRPMSQRPDAMNIVHRDAKAKGILLRPLSALKLEPTEVEKSGLVDRSKLLGIYGRGRLDQLQLAQSYGFAEIPSSGGGCILTEPKSSVRIWTIFHEFEHPVSEDFLLAKAGRFFHYNGCLLAINKTLDQAELLEKCAKDNDIVLELADYMGPLALGRSEKPWDETVVAEAASLMASYANKAVRSLPAGTPLRVSVKQQGEERFISVLPKRDTLFKEANREEMAAHLKEVNKKMTAARLADKKEKFFTWISRKEYQRQRARAKSEEE